jgi:dUTP pyrophosphatase
MIRSIAPKEVALIETGVRLDMSQTGVPICALMILRSSVCLRGLTLANGIGLIDQDYQGEIKIPLYNRSDELQFIKFGDRLAQLLFVSPLAIELRQVNEFTPTERGEKGFGSTGK